VRSAAKYKLVGYRPAGSLSSCCHGDAQVNLTWANSHRHTDARYAIPLFIWFLHGKTYFAARFPNGVYCFAKAWKPPCSGARSRDHYENEKNSFILNLSFEKNRILSVKIICFQNRNLTFKIFPEIY